jgi:hypothetical protein
MAFFDNFTDSIRQKWLQFFQMNRDWISMHMAVESVYTPDGGKRPPSYLILGVVNALEPKLAQLMYPFSKLNTDADTLIEVLGLNFDPDIALGNRTSPLQEPNGFHQSAGTDSDAEGFGQANWGDGAGINGQNGHRSDESEQIGSFGEMSFEAMALADDSTDDDGLEDLNPPEETAFSDVLSDVWGDANALEQIEDNMEALGEGGVFDDSEMARLFPNN